MAQLEVGDATIAYDVAGAGDPVVLVPGCGQPAVAWALAFVPRLVEAGHRVVTLDNRGVAPSSSPPAPYSVEQMAADVMAVVDHLGLDRVAIVGHSMGGWIAEVVAARHPERVSGAVLMGSCNAATSWEKAITEVERDLAAADLVLPARFYACETMRYLPPADLQDDGVVDMWLTLIGDLEPWPNPGRLGQYEACLAWSNDPGRSRWWPLVRCPVLVVAFEHDVDSPPVAARRAAAQLADARVVEIPAAGHLGIVTHPEEVLEVVVPFLSGLRSAGDGPAGRGAAPPGGGAWGHR